VKLQQASVDVKEVDVKEIVAAAAFSGLSSFLHFSIITAMIAAAATVVSQTSSAKIMVADVKQSLFFSYYSLAAATVSATRIRNIQEGSPLPSFKDNKFRMHLKLQFQMWKGTTWNRNI